jgi:hypothetical protein
VGDEVRLGGGFMFFAVTINLTGAGLADLPRVVATVARGLQARPPLPPPPTASRC